MLNFQDRGSKQKLRGHALLESCKITPIHSSIHGFDSIRKFFRPNTETFLAFSRLQYQNFLRLS